MADSPHILIVEATYYTEIAEELARGAIAELEQANASFERIAISGAFEIPAAVKMAVRSLDHFAGRRRFDGYIALGCVIRGETSHYDYICAECARKLQDLACEHTLALGFGLLTCENVDQARQRADTNGRNKGGEAARACLQMVEVKRQFHLYPR